MNLELRQALGEYFAAKVRGLLEEKEFAENVLNVLGKPILEEAPKTEKQYDLMKVVTVQAEGPRGQYLKITHENNESNPAYFALVEDLKQHKGSITRQGYFVFLFDDQKTAGMKLSNK